MILILSAVIIVAIVFTLASVADVIPDSAIPAWVRRMAWMEDEEHED